MAKKVLIIDIGNTATEFAVFENENLQEFLGFFKFPDDLENAKKALNSYKNKGFNIDDSMIFSVVPNYDEMVKNIVLETFGICPSLFDWKSYKLEKKNPKIVEAIGADLLADIKQAANEYGGNCLIADFGTVTKLLLLNKEGSFEGLSFIPGIEASLKSFSSNTALLPKIEEMDDINHGMGLNTIESMHHGVYWSTVYYVKEVLKSLNNKDCKLIITGGNLRYVKQAFPEAIVDKELTLKGMYALYKEIK